jgi:hypothetical protein
VTDSLVTARRALAQLREHQVERERHAAEVGRADQVARWHAEDQDSERSRQTVAERGVSLVPADGARR